MKKPIIALTMGDPAGVGPEICLKTAVDASVRRICVPVILGDLAVLNDVSSRCGLTTPGTVMSAEDFSAGAPTRRATTVDFHLFGRGQIRPGRIQKSAGEAAFRYLETAIHLALEKQVDAIVTAPINKEALHLAGHKFPGHTEILAAFTRAKTTVMMFASDAVICGLATTHCAYAEVPGLITRQRVRAVIELTAQAAGRLRGRPPRLIVCGLNPHAGEHGLFGNEERVIARAIEDAKKNGLNVRGPLPPDTAFRTGERGRTDAYVCMYHDQGLIPFKMLSFETGVNITLGLPIIRTSVDHGTALDIAWTGRADHRSMVQAVRYAVALSKR